MNTCKRNSDDRLKMKLLGNYCYFEGKLRTRSKRRSRWVEYVNSYRFTIKNICKYVLILHYAGFNMMNTDTFFLSAHRWFLKYSNKFSLNNRNSSTVIVVTCKFYVLNSSFLSACSDMFVFSARPPTSSTTVRAL